MTAFKEDKQLEDLAEKKVKKAGCERDKIWEDEKDVDVLSFREGD